MADPDYTNEIWKTIPFSPDYEVSDIGRIRRATPGDGTWVGRILKQGRSGSGYRHVAIAVPGRRHRSTRVHSIVAEVFIGPKPSPSHEIAHGDGDKTNNRADNLRWVTPIENAADKAKHGTIVRGIKHGMAKLTEAQAREILADTKTRVVDLADKYGVRIESIYNIKKGARWKHLHQ